MRPNDASVYYAILSMPLILDVRVRCETLRRTACIAWGETMRPFSATACIAATCIFALVTSAKADDKCQSVGELARTIMKKRQADAPMSAMMQAIARIPDEAAGKVARELAIMAYQQPDFSVEENQNKAIAEFGNQAELVCYQGG